MEGGRCAAVCHSLFSMLRLSRNKQNEERAATERRTGSPQNEERAAHRTKNGYTTAKERLGNS